MGQQQLLLITLGVIVVGMAVYGGLRLMDSYNQDNDRDQLMIQMQAVLNNAKQYSAKPVNLNGGDGSFEGYDPPNNMLTTSRYRIYVGTTAGSVTLTGFGTVIGTDRETPVQVLLTFSSSDNKAQSLVVN